VSPARRGTGRPKPKAKSKAGSKSKTTSKAKSTGKGKPSSKSASTSTSTRSASRGAAAPSRGSGRGRASASSRRGQPDRPEPRPRSRSAATRGLGGDQVEGRQATRELLLAGNRRVRELLVADDHDDSSVLQELVDLALELKVPVREISRHRLLGEARTDAPQGVIAHAAPLVEHDLEELAANGHGRSAPFLVAVDGVTDPGNLGSLIRSAECAGVTGLLLPRHRAVHITPAVTKAAAGAIEFVPMAVVGGLPTAISHLRDLGVWVIGLDAAGDRSLFDLTFEADGPVCLVLGSEGKGLARLTRERCDVLAGLPLLGQLGSLNVATAASVACYEIARRRLS
jgi:23S rRNA (guanosine2251-2'-O)-methyltransferase